MSEGAIGQPCERVKATLLEELAPQLEALAKAFSWGGLFAMFDDVVQAVEDMRAIGSGPDKKACVIHIVLAAYDTYRFDIPLIPDLTERQVLKWVLEIAIDGIVAILNKRGIFVHGT